SHRHRLGRAPQERSEAMSRVTSIRAACLVAVVGSVLAFSASPARAATLCVGPGAGCLGTIQAAVNAANDGDTITIAPGVYAGGIQINVSISIVGAAAKQTTISGGPPVVLVGAPFPWPTTPATVSISGVTIRDGVNNSFPDAPVVQGGGVNITPTRNPIPNEPGVTGAKVTITDSVITHNRVYATDQIPPGFCGPLSCAFADGGGIDNSGDLTLVNTQVTDNEAVSPPGVATGVGEGGISNHDPAGTLLLKRSVVSDNHARGDAPEARGAGSGGIGGGNLTIESSLVSGNTVE